MRKLAFAAFAAGTMLGCGAHAASFDCAKARAPDEQAICANRGLNDKDVTLAVSLKMTAHLVAMGQRGALMDGQRAWLSDRRRCVASIACLNRSYNAQLAAVRTVFEGVASRRPF